ncbi:MAG: metallophosphoesterase [Bryobacteraceae bacterium]
MNSVLNLRLLADLVALCLILPAQWAIGRWVAARYGRWGRWFCAAAAAWLLVGFGLSFHRLYLVLEAPAWLRGLACGSTFLWLFASTGAWLVHRLWRAVTPQVDTGRRRWLTWAGRAAVAAPVALTGFGAFIQRTNFREVEVDLPVPNLPADLEGLRLVQLSDIHLSPFLSERDFARAVDAANSARAHIALVTGDLISVAGDPLDECLNQVARLRADAGIWACLGNHEAYARAERYTTERGARLGVRFLRGEAATLRFGSARLRLAGVDYQSVWDKPSYLAGMERLVEPGAVNVLLSHNPDVFPVAAKKGFDVTLGGHTHGGQVTVEILHQTLNLARFVTPYVYGLYRAGPASLYVTRGIGTIGVPLRIGAQPEVAVLRLKRA